MTIGEVHHVVAEGWIRFLDSSQMDDLPYGVLKHWLEHLDRKQRQYAADINERAKDILNRYQHLNRWLTEEVRDAILEKNDILQVCSDQVIQETCCRFCSRTFIGPLNLSRIEIEELKIRLEIHYRTDHPEGWALMNESLHSNMLPYL